MCRSRVQEKAKASDAAKAKAASDAAARDAGKSAAELAVERDVKAKVTRAPRRRAASLLARGARARARRRLRTPGWRAKAPEPTII